MSNAPAPTRAEEGRETQYTTVPDWVPLYLAEKERAAQAEAEVARLTAALAEARQANRELHRRAQKAEGFKQRHRGGFNYVFNRRIEDRRARRAAEASASALRERVATLEAALQFYADDENYRMHGLCNPENSYFTGPNTARTALEAPHADN